MSSVDVSAVWGHKECGIKIMVYGFEDNGVQFVPMSVGGIFVGSSLRTYSWLPTEAFLRTYTKVNNMRRPE